METALRASEGRVVLKQIKADEKTNSGIIIPETARQETERATVVSVGLGKISKGVRHPVEIKVGDTVIYNFRKSGMITHNEVEYIVTNQEDLLAIIEE